MKKNVYTLRIKVLIGLLAYLSLVALQAVYQLAAIDRAGSSHALLGELSQLERSIETLAHPSENYLANAARDFESYRRDVQVFYRDILGDFDRFGQHLEGVRTAFESGQKNSLLAGLWSDAQSRAALANAVDNAFAEWQRFETGFQEQLGPDEAEPRLEWGTEFVVSNHPKLAMAVDNMTVRYRELLDQEQAMAASLLRGSLVALLALGLIGLYWFYRRVIRRIGSTVEACQIVAGGDFGYTLPVEGNDEISVLSKAFNSVSSRTHLVLNMMADLQQITSVEQGLAVIVQGSGNYLPVSWAGFMEVSNDGQRMSLCNAIPPKTLQGWGDRTTNAEQPFGERLAEGLISKRSIVLSELDRQVLENPEEAFLRGLVRATEIKALLALPVGNGSGWEGVLLFGSRNGEYRQDHAELLEKLAPLMASSLARIARAQSASRRPRQAAVAGAAMA